MFTITRTIRVLSPRAPYGAPKSACGGLIIAASSLACSSLSQRPSVSPKAVRFGPAGAAITPEAIAALTERARVRGLGDLVSALLAIPDARGRQASDRKWPSRELPHPVVQTPSHMTQPHGRDDELTSLSIQQHPGCRSVP